MKNFEREYKTLKLFGKKRNDEKLEFLSEKEDDFAFKDFYIQEHERWLHIHHSRRVFFNAIGNCLMIFGFFYIKHPIIFFTLVGVSLISRIFSFISKCYFIDSADKYVFGYMLMENVIIKKHYK